MKDLVLKNSVKEEVHYLKWEVENPKACLVISHGMAEHPERYDDVAKYLNAAGYQVYAIFQVGHGKYAPIKGHMPKGGFDRCVSNLSELVDLAKKETGKDCFLLGHSMGSFVGQLYIERNHNIKGLILSGSSAATPIMKMGSTVASLVCMLHHDNTKPSKFMDKLSFGAYNNAIDNPKTSFDWLNRDEKEVKKYIDDPLCGFVCSRMFFKNMCGGLKVMGNKKELAKVDTKLPILIHGGSCDPVSNCGVGLDALKEQYEKLGVKDISFYKYEGARHEIYNELNKKEVYENTVKFLDAHL